MHPDTDSSSLRALPGRLLLNLGAAGCLLMLAAQTGGLPPDWERSIRANSPLWGMSTAACIILGVLAMWSRAHGRSPWAPSLSGKRFTTMILYTRSECPLCDEAAETLSKYRAWLPDVIEVNIEENDELLEEFGEWVPVVEIDNRVRFKGAVNEFLLRRLIEGTAPAPRLRSR